MAATPNAITVTCSLRIQNGNSQEQTQPTYFQASQLNPGGPSPGLIEVPTLAGVDVLFPELILPGVAWIQNLDPVNYVTLGIRDTTNNKFYPLFEIQAGEFYPCRFSRHLGEDYIGTGTGGLPPAVFHLRANAAQVLVVVKAFNV